MSIPKTLVWIVIAFVTILVMFVALIIITLASLPHLGDERKNFIKMKAQSYSFAVVVILLIIQIIESIYLTIWGKSSYDGISPFSLHIAISVVYLVTLLIYKKKYGN